MKTLTIFFALVAYMATLGAQSSRLYTPDFGLSNTSFNSIAQDKDGFLWFATFGGLNRFDGYNFVVYQHNGSDTCSLDNDAVYSVFADSKDRIWVGTEHGLNMYNKQLDNFYHFPFRFRNVPLNPIVTSILEDSSHQLWLTTSVGLVRINPEKETSQFFSNKLTAPTTLARDMMNAALLDRNGNLWIASDKEGVYRYSPSANKFENYKFNGANSPIWDNSVLSLGMDTAGNILIGTVKGGLSIFDSKTKTFRTINYFNKPGNLFNGGIYTIVTDKTGQVWLGTERNGLKRYDTRTATITDANHELGIDNIDNTKIHCYPDMQGNLWLGIDYVGIYLKKQQSKPFYSIRKSSNNAINLSNNIVKAILIDHLGNLLIGTDGGGLNVLSPKANRMVWLEHDVARRSSIPDNAVIAIFQDNKKNVWLGTYLGGLSLFDPIKKTFTTYLIDSLGKGRDFNYVTSIAPDGKDNLWVATVGGGLHYFDTQQHTFTNFATITKHAYSSMSMYLTTLLLDRSGTLWIGSYNGLYYWNPQNKEWGEYSQSNQRITGDAIYSIVEDSKGKIWFGTPGGLYYLENKKDPPIQYTTANGLSHNSVFGILEDNRKNLWLSTLNGISKFNTASKTFTNYYTYDGLPGNEYRPASCYKASNGNLYFGSTSGLVYFNPDSIKDAPSNPTLVLTKLKIFNQVVQVGKMNDGHTRLEKPLNEAEKITLQYTDNNFTLEFVAIDYQAPEKIKYAYQLVGFDNRWTTRDYTQRYATYTNLSPGRYTFKLKSTNIDGQWNTQVHSITIVVKPPFWLTWWAYILYALILGAILVAARRFEIYRLDMRNQLKLEHLERQKLEELNQSKMQFFSNVSHEFRTPLTLILGPIERLRKESLERHVLTQIEFVHRNAMRLLRLVNMLLDLQKVEKSEMKLKARLSDVVAFAKEITLSFTELTQNKKIELVFETTIDKMDIWFDPEKLDKVLFNLLSNAVKFTPKGGLIRVSVAGDERTMTLQVSDSGKGMSAEHLNKIFTRFYQVDDNDAEIQIGSGIGLNLSKHLVELHGGTIEVRSKEGHGSEFVIAIPRHGEQLTPEQKVSDTLVPGITVSLSMADFDPNESASGSQLKLNLPEGKALKPFRILIVEDDLDVRSYLSSDLSQQYQIIEASDGLEGWNIAKKSIPDLIISDVMMPNMDGIELCKRIKTDLHTSHIPVILLTARTTIENRIEGLETGADSYIPKPFHPHHLRIRIEKLIELRQVLMAKFSKSISFEAKEMTLTSPDERFLQKAINLVKENLSNTDLNIEDMGADLGMSRVHLYRKLKALTNQTPSEFVRTIRLKQAAYLLSQNKVNISEVAYAVGFNSHQYFTQSFQKYFNMSPTEYSQKEKTNHPIE